MSDLIARLRTMSATGWHPIGNEAADAIDRLTRERDHETLLNNHLFLRPELVQGHSFIYRTIHGTN